MHENNSTIRGMVSKIRHMVTVEPIWVATDGPKLEIAQRRLHGRSVRGSAKTVGIEEYVHAYPVLAGEPKVRRFEPGEPSVLVFNARLCVRASFAGNRAWQSVAGRPDIGSAGGGCRGALETVTGQRAV